LRPPTGDDAKADFNDAVLHRFDDRVGIAVAHMNFEPGAFAPRAGDRAWQQRRGD